MELGLKNYKNFIEEKSQLVSGDGFDPLWLPDFLYPFQECLTDWAIRRGRAAIFAECGMGKTPMQLVWAENIRRKTNKPVLILTPIAVGFQTEKEGEKFGIECHRSRDGKVYPITITNYERLHYFNRDDFSGVVADESSAIKHFTGKRQKYTTEFMKKIRYRLLCSATPAPNDYVELGTSSEALGQLGYMDMLSMFFRTKDGAMHRTWGLGQKYFFKAHAKDQFWRWVCSWARAIREPSDLGFKDDRFSLPPLNIEETTIKTDFVPDGFLLPVPSVTMSEERQELRATVEERCKIAAGKVIDTGEPAVVWCHLNTEGDLLEKLIPDAEQISGSNTEEEKEEKLIGFSKGDIRVLITKPKIGGWGMNWQHCAHMTVFPSHSFESYYQSVRRCWRFGQTRPVKVDIITTEGQEGIIRNLRRKERQAEEMYKLIVQEMKNILNIKSIVDFKTKEEIPSWL